MRRHRDVILYNKLAANGTIAEGIRHPGDQIKDTANPALRRGDTSVVRFVNTAVLILHFFVVARYPPATGGLECLQRTRALTPFSTLDPLVSAACLVVIQEAWLEDQRPGPPPCAAKFRSMDNRHHLRQPGAGTADSSGSVCSCSEGRS